MSKLVHFNGQRAFMWLLNHENQPTSEIYYGLYLGPVGALLDPLLWFECKTTKQVHIFGQRAFMWVWTITLAHLSLRYIQHKMLAPWTLLGPFMGSQLWFEAKTPSQCISGLILGLCPANKRRCYKVMLSLIGWAQTCISMAPELKNVFKSQRLAQ